MTDEDVLASIDRLVAEEHDLRSRHEAGELDNEQEQQRMTALETQLDQAWDLLRQRRAREDLGEDPDTAHERSKNEVEGYLQ